MADTRPYIRLRKSLPDDPRVQDLAELFARKTTAGRVASFYVTFAVGLLARFWIDCDEFTDADGRFCGGSVEVLRRKYGRFPEEKLTQFGWFMEEADGTPVAVNYKGRKALVETGTGEASHARAGTIPDHTSHTNTGITGDYESGKGTLGLVSATTLSDDLQLLDWYELARERGEPFATGTPENRLAVFALAERALATGKKPAALFVSYLQKREWHKVTGRWDQAGQARLKRMEADSICPAAVSDLASRLGGGHV